MSSMGVGVCIALRNKAVAAGAKPILFGASADLAKLLAMMKIDQMYKFAKDQGELDILLRG
jgi:anti-anti-sigma regulatory factor